MLLPNIAIKQDKSRLSKCRIDRSDDLDSHKFEYGNQIRIYSIFEYAIKFEFTMRFESNFYIRIYHEIRIYTIFYEHGKFIFKQLLSHDLQTNIQIYYFQMEALAPYDYHVRCLAHVINLAAQDALSKLKVGYMEHESEILDNNNKIYDVIPKVSS